MAKGLSKADVCSCRVTGVHGKNRDQTSFSVDMIRRNREEDAKKPATSDNGVRKTAATNREPEHFEDYNYKEPTDAVIKHRSRQKGRIGNNYSSDDSEIDERPQYDEYAHSRIR
jgi:hypothetical protein